MTNKKDFAELLKGCRPVKDDNGNIIVQTIMNMQVVCLTTDDEYSLDNRFENPLKSLVARNHSYGQLTFTNNAGRDVIIPTQMAVMTKQRAQNHGMVKAGYVPKKSQRTYHDAGCVEGSQPGYITDTDEYRFIPVTMREMLFNAVGVTQGHSNIYPAIVSLGNKTNAQTDTYLDRYFSKYDKKLEQFIAHFERPDKFIGIIVLIDDEIVAIDKFPSFTYAEQVWEMMIRDCYGSMAVMSEINNKKNKKYFTDVFNKEMKEGVDVLDVLASSLQKTKEKITKNVVEKIEDLMDFEFNMRTDPDSHEVVKSFILECDGYVGQLISESDYNHLVSIVRKESFNPNAMRRVNEMKRKARSQNRFTL